jgi:transglutaminase-like putative cysteine protease
MLFTISHRTKLEYSKPITESVMEVRARPRTDERQVLRQFEISISPMAQPNYHSDWLGNTVHQFSVLGQHSQVIVDARAVVETRPIATVLEELNVSVDSLRADHRSWDFLQDHGPVTEDPALPALAKKMGLDRVSTVGDVIGTVLDRTRDVISYQKGITTSSSTVRDVLRLKAGVCQDFAHLALALLRRSKVPCRYVSGYLYKAGTPELETHAWVEAFVPNVGWVGLDPTHGQIVGEEYVALAVGRSYADVPPNRGVYRGEAKEQITVTVQMEPVEQQVRLTPFSSSLQRQSTPPPSMLQVQAASNFVRGLEQQRFRPNAVGLVVQQQRQQQQ